MRAPTLGLALLLFAVAACSNGGASDFDPLLAADAHAQSGQIEAEASLPASTLGVPGAAGEFGRQQILREVSEADIFQLEGDTAYLLSTWRGLAIIDLANLQILGRLPLDGYPVELYRRGDRAFVLLTSFQRSLQLLELDVANPQAPALVATAAIDGEARTSRVVGDVLYVVSSNSAVSFDLATAPFAQRATVGLAGGADIVTASAELLFVAQNRAANVDLLLFHIGEPDGAIQVRGQLTLPGMLTDDKKLDCRGNVLRAVTYTDGGIPRSELFTIDVADPQAPTILGSLQIASGEQLFGTEFTDTRAYVVTFEQIDPLWVIDLSDPSHPYIAGELLVPGYSTQIVADGDQLVAFGVEPPHGASNVVSLFDVADPARPALLARLSFGETGETSAALHDRKSFHVFADTVLVPTWDGVAVIDRAPAGLQLRGIAPLVGGARRAFLHGNEVCAFGDEELVAIDRLSLAARGRVTLASNVVDVGRRTDGTLLELVQRGDSTELGGASLRLYADGMHVFADRAAVTGWDAAGRAAYVVDCSTTPATVSRRLQLPWGGFACPTTPTSLRSGAPSTTGSADFVAPVFVGPVAAMTDTGKLILRGLPGHDAHRLGDGVVSDGIVVLDIPTARLLPGIQVRRGIVTGFVADGDGVAFSIGRFVRNDAERRPMLRHELLRLDFADGSPSSIGIVPGYVVALSGDTAYCVQDHWDRDWSTTSELHACSLAAAGRVLSTLPLPSYAYDFRAAADTLCYSWSGVSAPNPILTNWRIGGRQLWQADYHVHSVRLSPALAAGPSIGGDIDYRSILRVESNAVLLTREGFTVERWDLAANIARLDFTTTVAGYAQRAHADPAHPGHYLLPLGYAGTMSVP
jgi:hypothetical protein